MLLVPYMPEGSSQLIETQREASGFRVFIFFKNMDKHFNCFQTLFHLLLDSYLSKKYSSGSSYKIITEFIVIDKRSLLSFQTFKAEFKVLTTAFVDQHFQIQNLTLFLCILVSVLKNMLYFYCKNCICQLNLDARLAEIPKHGTSLLIILRDQFIPFYLVPKNLLEDFYCDFTV